MERAPAGRPLRLRLVRSAPVRSGDAP